MEAPDALPTEDVEARALALWPRLVAGERRALARAISLCESRRADDRKVATDLVKRALREERAREVVRIGITGPAGVGKSSLLDVLGAHVIDAGLRPAVLAIDPSSRRTGGSLLGDQTRMARLVGRGAFVRPSPTRGHLGGANAHTLEVAWLCAAAGFGPVFIETVGVGQNESEVSEIVDVLVLLLQPGAGDELQGLKRGLLEHADLLVVAQADGERLSLAEETRARFESAWRLLRGNEAPAVALVSALEGRGVAELWSTLEAWVAGRRASGAFGERRREQRRDWFRRALLTELLERLRSQEGLGARLTELEDKVAQGELDVPDALAAFLGDLPW